jgi:3-phenylpropionate/cinnamic acid dioxygenase small subunit
VKDSATVIADKLYRYCELFDTGQFDAFAAQFEQGRWFRAPPGKEAILAWLDEHVLTYDGLPRTKHVTNNLVVDVDEAADTATASSYVTVYQSLPDFPLQPIFMGRYRDRFERVDGDWVWRERQVTPDLYGDTTHHTRGGSRQGQLTPASPARPPAPPAGKSTAQRITDRLYRYCELFDTGDFDAFADQFEHGRWFWLEPGRDALRRWIDEHVFLYDGLPRTKHVTSNVVVDVDEEAGTATAVSYVAIFQALPDFPLQPIFMGRYRDRFERVEGEWLWRERASVPDLQGDTSHHTHDVQRPD